MPIFMSSKIDMNTNNNSTNKICQLEMIKSSKMCIHLIKDPPSTWRKTRIPKRKINSSTLQLEILMSFQQPIEPVGKKKSIGYIRLNNTINLT